MNIAGENITEENFIKKEVFLDQKLVPITSISKGDSKSSAFFTINFFYIVNGENERLAKISFESSNENLKSFCIEEKLINRYLSLKRADDKAMEVLRKISLETKSLISLKKYAFECLKYAA